MTVQKTYTVLIDSFANKLRNASPNSFFTIKDVIAEWKAIKHADDAPLNERNAVAVLYAAHDLYLNNTRKGK